MKLFRTTNIEIIQACQEMFHCEFQSVQLTEKYNNNKIIVLNDHCD